MAADLTFTEKWMFGTATMNVDVGSDIGLDDVVRQGSGITGRRSPALNRVRQGERMVTGNCNLLVNGPDLDVILPCITGGTKGGGNLYSMANTLTDIDIYRKTTSVECAYMNCKFGRATFAASMRQFLKVGLSIMGFDEDDTSDEGIPDRADTKSPYVFEDGVFEVNDTAYSVDGFLLTLDHGLVPKYFNSLTPSRLNEGPRVVTVEVNLPHGDASSLRGRSIAGAKFEATFTNGSDIFKIQLDKIVFPTSRIVAAENEFTFTLRGQAVETLVTGSYVQEVKFYNTVS